MIAPFGVVLAGGRSTRMGRDKALLAWEGRPLVDHALGLLRSCCGEVRIAGARPGLLADLARFAPVLEDLHPGCGPLAGIEAALTVAGSAELVFFLPVDVPLLPAALLHLLLERSALTGAGATIPTLAGRPQPLCSAIRPALLPSLTAALDAGEYKVMRVFEQLAPGELDLFSIEAVAAVRDEWPAEPPVHRWFQNLNTPEDLARAAGWSRPVPASTTLVESCAERFPDR